MTDLQRKRCLAKGEVPEGYRNTPIGILPSDWGYAKLGDLSVELTETAGQKEYETVSISAGIGFVNQAEKFGKELSGKQYEKYIVLHKGDFSYNKGNSNRYPQGCIYRLNDREEAAVPNVFESFRIVKGCPEYYEQLFISGFLNHQMFRLINHGVRDDGLLNLTRTDFYNCLLPVPPLRESEKIVDILSTCDGMIDKYEKKAEQYRKLKKHLLDKMFPKEGFAVPEIRFTGFDDTWEQRKFSDFTWNAGARNSKNLELEPYAVTNDRGFVRQSDAHDEFGYMKDVDRKAYNIVKPNSFAYNPARINVGSIGYYEGVENVIVSSLYEVFQTADDVDDRFLWHWFKSAEFQKWIERLQEGSVRLYFYYDKLCECHILMPSVAEQKEVARVLDELDNLIILHQREAEAWKTMKKVLQQLLLTGVVRV